MEGLKLQSCPYLSSYTFWHLKMSEGTKVTESKPLPLSGSRQLSWGKTTPLVLMKSKERLGVMEPGFKGLSNLLSQSHFVFLKDDRLSQQGVLSAERGRPLLENYEHADRVLQLRETRLVSGASSRPCAAPQVERLADTHT